MKPSDKIIKRYCYLIKYMMWMDMEGYGEKWIIIHLRNHFFPAHKMPDFTPKMEENRRKILYS